MIYIITTCTRPENLETISKTIPPECTWVVVFDQSVGSNYSVEGAVNMYSPFTGGVGMPNRNYALDNLEINDLDWVYVLDDDNVIHPNWYSSVKDIQEPSLNMVSWGQVWMNNSVRLEPALYPRVGNIDTASYMVRGRVIKNLRYAIDYCADGILAEQAGSFGGYLCLHEYLCYNNYLRTPEDRKI